MQASPQPLGADNETMWSQYKNQPVLLKDSVATQYKREDSMRSILLLLLGVPIPIVLLIALFSH